MGYQDDIKRKGTEHEVKGNAKEGAGKVQKKFGEITGNEEQEAKGAAREAEGKVQGSAGEAARKAT
jgi:uncharacterized protein YjbJ (UPF0337 family)